MTNMVGGQELFLTKLTRQSITTCPRVRSSCQTSCSKQSRRSSAPATTTITQTLRPVTTSIYTTKLTPVIVNTIFLLFQFQISRVLILLNLLK